MIPFVDLKPYVELVAGVNDQNRWGLGQGMEQFLAAREFIGGGPTTQEFEKKLAWRLGADHAIACANGTDAIQLALRACGIERGHHVAMPNTTFWATFEAIVNVGATPILLDIDPDDYQLSVEGLIHARSNTRFSAVVLPHLFGWCSRRLTEIRTFCANERITLIEDGAQAFGVKYNNESVFKDADVATLSFHPAKVIGGIGDGGAVLTKNPRTAARIRSLANHGRSAHFEHAAVGWNSRMDAIQAAWLLRALDVSDKVIEARVDLLDRYVNQRGPLGNAGVDELGTCVDWPANVDGNGYLALNMLHGDTTKAHSASFSLAYRVQERLHERGVEGRRLYPITIADQPGAKGYGIPIGPLANSRTFAERAFCLPLYYGMTDTQVELCANAFEEVTR